RDRDVGSGARTRSATGSRAEQIAESAEPAQVAHEDAQRFREIDVVESAGAAAQSCLAISIVEGALVGIAQHVVGFGDCLELLFGVFCPVVAIGVVRHRLIAIRSLYLGIAGTQPDANALVLI